MFTDAGAHFIQYTQQTIALSEYRQLKVETDELIYTHFSDYYSMRLAISEKKSKLHSAFPVSR